MKNTIVILVAIAAIPAYAMAAGRSTPVTVVNDPNSAIPVVVTNPASEVVVAGRVDTSGSQISARILGKPEVTISQSITQQIPVTIYQRVNSDNAPEDRTGETTRTFHLCVGISCARDDAADQLLRDALAPEFLRAFVVTSVTAMNFPAPAQTDYAIGRVGICRPGLFPATLGLIYSTDGRQTTHLNFRPGIVVNRIEATERLCATLLGQSTTDVDITIHGFLVPLL